MMRRKWMAVGAVTVSAVLAVGACSSDSGDETTTTEKATTTSEAPKELSVSTPEGEVSLSLDGNLPSDWPEDFPRTASMKVKRQVLAEAVRDQMSRDAITPL